MKITAVIVLYKQTFSESESVQSVKSIFDSAPYLSDYYRFIVYDNSPLPCAETQPFDFEYIHDKSNEGLSKAYNFALAKAVDSGCEWLLLLDQDTVLNFRYFETQLKALGNIASDVAAVVPRIYLKNGKQISPISIHHRLNDFIRKGKAVGCGCQKDIGAINSATLVRADFISTIGGFPTMFKLDALDMWIFRCVYYNDFDVFVIDVNITHDLSIKSKKFVPLARYEIIMQSMVDFAVYCVPRKEKFYKFIRAVLYAFWVLRKLKIKHFLVSWPYICKMLFKKSRFNIDNFKAVK
jgi:GT2 family glycosyltransferase